MADGRHVQHWRRLIGNRRHVKPSQEVASSKTENGGDASSRWRGASVSFRKSATRSTGVSRGAKPRKQTCGRSAGRPVVAMRIGVSEHLIQRAASQDPDEACNWRDALRNSHLPEPTIRAASSGFAATTDSLSIIQASCRKHVLRPVTHEHGSLLADGSI